MDYISYGLLFYHNNYDRIFNKIIVIGMESLSDYVSMKGIYTNEKRRKGKYRFGYEERRLMPCFWKGNYSDRNGKRDDCWLVNVVTVRKKA